MKDNIVSLETKRKEKYNNKVFTIRNPYHIDNVIEDLENFKERLNNPPEFGVIIGCDEPKKTLLQRWFGL